MVLPTRESIPDRLTFCLNENMKTKKKYPMNGPSLQAQIWMERPRFYRNELLAYFKTATNVTRPETRAILDLP